MPALGNQFAKMLLRIGPFGGAPSEPASSGHPPNASGDGELAFLGHPLESFGRAFDPVLAVVAIGRQQTDHLVGATGGRSGNIAGSKIDCLSNAEFVLQRPLHQRKNAGRSRCTPRPENRAWYSMPPVNLA